MPLIQELAENTACMILDHWLMFLSPNTKQTLSRHGQHSALKEVNVQRAQNMPFVNSSHGAALSG